MSEIAKRFPGLPPMRLYVRADPDLLVLYRADLELLFRSGGRGHDVLRALHAKQVSLAEVHAILAKI